MTFPHPPAPPTHDRERRALEGVQRRIVAQAEGPVSTIELPVARVSGRVLAEAIPGVERGTVLTAVHVATLAGLGLTTVRVFERTRVGIIALHGRGEPESSSRHASVTLATLVAAVEQMGAKAFGSSCRNGDEECLVRSVKMFAAECPLVLILGFPGAELIASLKRAGLSCDSSGIRAIGLRPFGEIRLAKVGAAHMVALPEEPGSALATFAALVSPLLRALSGRSELLPALPVAILADEAGTAASPEGLAWVRERASSPGSSPEIVRCSIAPACLAGATGLAWPSPEHDPGSPGKRIYLPFKTWLG